MTAFSIITPSLNSATVIGNCLRSVGEQGAAAGHEVEHIVVDGGSRDRTQAFIEQSDFPVTLVQQPPEGIYAAVNSGIAAARGDVIGILHADDFYASSEALSRVAEVFSDPSVGACYADLCYVDRADPARIVRYWRAGAFSPGRFRNGWMPPHPTFFLRRALYEEYGGYRTDLGTAADYELMLRMLFRHGIAAEYIPRVLVHMRGGGASNATWKARVAANRMDREAWRVNGLRPRAWTLWAKPLRKIPQWWLRQSAGEDRI